MSFPRQTRVGGMQLFIVGLAWLISRGVALFAVRSRIPFYWEVFEVKKLLEYSFWHRAGALVNIQYLPGHLSNPELFNYVNHPYPIMWIFAGAYRVCGPWGMMLIVLGIGLASCLAVLVVLTRSFTPRSAFFATLLFALAPSAILFDVDTNLVTLGAVIWPATTLIISRVRPDGEQHWQLAFLVGVVVFLCGQISWFISSTLPALLAITAKPNVSLSQQFLAPWKNSFWLAIILGGAATLSVFLLQVVLYSPNLSASFAYAFAHTGSQGGFLSSRVKMSIFVAAKGLLLVGPALVAGALCGLIYWAKGWTKSALLRGAMVALACALLAALILIRFYYRERTPYAYVLFPAAVLTASALEKAKGWLYTVLGTLALAGLAYVCLQASSPYISNTGRAVADFLRETTRPSDVIMSNLREQQLPFPSWDTGSRDMTMLAADRLLYYDIETAPQVAEREREFQSQRIRPRYLFLRDSMRSLSPDLEQSIQRNGSLLVKRSLPMPVEVPSLSLRLRSVYWRIVGSPFAQRDAELPTGHGNMEFELYELTGAK
jgi:hypothetical protein